MIPVLPPNAENLRRACEDLAAGRLVAFPTETVYGLGANALDPMALARIFEVKRRPFFDPLIVHIADRASLETVCLPGDDCAARLMDRFWPGPLTLVLPKTPAIPELATSGLPTVAVRMPDHPVALELIRMAGFPLAAPSANPFGRLSPTSAAHVRDQFHAGIALILDGGPCPIGVESTILSLAGETPMLLRAGGIPREEIEAVIGPIGIAGPMGIRASPSGPGIGTTAAPDRDASANTVRIQPQAPGQLPGHYAPRTRMRLVAPGAGLPGGIESLRTGWLGFRGVPGGSFVAAEVLSPAGSLREAAANLFAGLHRLDRLGLDLILAETVAEEGLGAAIMDRLRKAEAGSAER